MTAARQRFKKHPHKRQFRARPLVTIALYHAGDMEATQRSLQSILKTSYRKRDIVIVGAPKSAFARFPPSQKISFTKTEPQNPGRGELVIKLRGGDTLEPSALARAVWHMNNQPQLTDVIMATRPYFSPYLPHLFSAYWQLGAAIFQKSLSIVDGAQANQATVILSRRNFPNQPHRAFYYADDATVAHPPIRKIYSLLKTQHKNNQGSWPSQCASVTLVSLLTYSAYVSVWQDQSALFTLLLACSALLMTLAIWWNTHLPFLQKVLFTIFMPVSAGYFLLLLALHSLKIFANMVKAVFPRRIGLFVWVKNILRIV